jgi:hypothetical protein
MAAWYAAPVTAGAVAPFVASQQASLSGILTALIFQAAMAWIEGSSKGPSKIVVCVCTHLYSVPERFTPRSETTTPSAVSI